MREATVIFDRTSRNFTRGVIYKAKRLFKQWSWMIMAWDNFGIGRYIHQNDYGKYKLTPATG